LSVGYYRGTRSSSWHIRRTVDGRKVYQRIAKADDYADADGETVFSYDQAVQRAMASDKAKPATAEGKYTVAEAVEDYLNDLEARSPRGYHDAYLRYRKHVLPKFRKRAVMSLTRTEIRRWHQQIAATKSEDPEKYRQRCNTANRNLSSLKAALNFSYHEGHVSDRSAWDQVKPFREVDAPRVRYLSEAEARRLINRASREFRPLIRAGLLTGCRYGEIISVEVNHFDADAAALQIHEGKTGKVRNVPLTDEGLQFFVEQTAGRTGSERIFLRDSGRPWRKSEQSRPMRATCIAAKIEPPVSFHILRHSYGSLLARKRVPLQIISAAMGHADTRMTQRHYAHLSPDHVANEVRKHLPIFVQRKSKVARLK
jgi:integrase